MKSRTIWYITKHFPTRLECAGVYKMDSPTSRISHRDQMDHLMAQFKDGGLLHVSLTETDIDVAKEEHTTKIVESYFRQAPEVLELNVAAKAIKAKKKPITEAAGKNIDDLFAEQVQEFEL